MTEPLHNLIIQEIDFKKILPLWKLLWPNTSNILQMSSMQYLGGHDTDIYTKFKPTFLGLYHNKTLVGGVSGHKSSREDYRIRGIYILSKYRAKGLSKILFDAIILQAKKENSNLIWSFPKKQALFAYKKIGFIPSSKWIHNTHCFVYYSK